MEINTNLYETYYNELEHYHPYLIPQIVGVRPWGTRGIQITLNNGQRFNYDSSWHSIRRVVEYAEYEADDVTDENTREIFANNLAELMLTSGINQTELSKRTGLSSGTISNYISKKATPSLTAIRKIAHALDCPIADLIG